MNKKEENLVLINLLENPIPNELKKQSGIYIIKIGNYSYIGMSTNIFSRLNTHKTAMKKLFMYQIRTRYEEKASEFRNLLIESIKNKNMHIKWAFYQKLLMVAIENNYQAQDVKFAIITTDENINLDQEEVSLIEKYDSEFKGFNGQYARYFKNMMARMSGYEVDKSKETLENSEEKRRSANIIRKDEDFVPWYFWQIECIENKKMNQNKVKKWELFCNKIISNL